MKETNSPQTLGEINDRAQDYLSCPVCFGSKILTGMPHLDFKGACIFICANRDCGHGWTDYDKLFVSDKQFKTFTPRADAYCTEILDRFPGTKSILEIGPSSDFYFLRKINEQRPDIQTYAHDIVDYSERAPSFVKFIKDIGNIPKTDMTYMCHSLEHIIDLNELVQILKHKTKLILVEVPSNPVTKWAQVRKGQWPTAFHYHFFNEKSLPLLFLKHGFSIQQTREAEPPSSTKNFPFSPTYNLYIEVSTRPSSRTASTSS